MRRKDLKNYQLSAINFIKQQKKCALYLEMGLGKTVITLTAVSDLLEQKLVKRILIIAPLRVAQTTWHTEAKKWEHTKDLTCSIIIGTQKQRLEASHKKADIYIINRENVKWLFEICALKFDCIVIDESSSFKNPSSKRFKTLKKQSYDYLIELTGTPSPNSLLDLWSQIYLIDQGKRLGKSMVAYKLEHFTSDYMGYKFTPKNNGILIHKAISDIALSMRNVDYLDLPRLIKINTYVVLEPALMSKYKELEREFIAIIKNVTIEATTKATMINKLVQYCQGAVYDSEKEYVEVHTHKLDALEEIIEDNSNDNFLVAYNYESDLVRLMQRFKYARILKNEQDKKDWNDQKIKLFFVQPASCSMGLNLQQGGNNLIWFCLTWNLEHYLQMNARLHRQGQTKPVIINHIMVQNCVDERILKVLNAKHTSQEDVLNFLLRHCEE